MGRDDRHRCTGSVVSVCLPMSKTQPCAYSRIGSLDPLGPPGQQDPHAPTQDIPLTSTSFQPALDLILQDLPGGLVLPPLLILGEQGGRELETVRDNVRSAFLEDGRVLQRTGEFRAEGVGIGVRVDLLRAEQISLSVQRLVVESKQTRRTIFSQSRLNSMMLGVKTTLGVPGQSRITEGSFCATSPTILISHPDSC